jgi:hypothetical protein
MLIKMRVINIDREGEGKIPVAISWQTAGPSSVNFREIARGGVFSPTPSLKAAYFRDLSSI